MLQTYTEGLQPRRLRHRPHAGLPVGQRRARAARRGRDRPRAAHRPPRRRLHVAVADRVPGPLDPRARPRRLRVAAVGRAPASATSACTAGPRLQRRRPAPLPAAARPRRASARAQARGRRGALRRADRRRRSSRARARSRCSRASRSCARRVPDALLLIAGGTTLFDYRAELERFAERADELGVTEHVWRLGALESEELERLFRAADVFAFPSVKEGFGLVGAGGDRRRAAARRVRPRRLPRLPHRRRVRAAHAGRRPRRARARARARETRQGAAHPAARGRPRRSSPSTPGTPRPSSHERVYEHIEVARWR